MAQPTGLGECGCLDHDRAMTAARLDVCSSGRWSSNDLNPQVAVVSPPLAPMSKNLRMRTRPELAVSDARVRLWPEQCSVIILEGNENAAHAVVVDELPARGMIGDQAGEGLVTRSNSVHCLVRLAVSVKSGSLRDTFM